MEPFITWHDYLGSEAVVQTRVGTERANSKAWDLSTDGVATFYPRDDDIWFIHKLMDSGRLVAQVTPYREAQVE
jgi:type VI secretion system protein VasI